jgi:hypothetical protein
MNIKEIAQKYANIEDKIPQVWPDYERAGIELAQDIATEWDIMDSELIRVIALVEMRMAGMSKPRFGLSSHIYQPFSFAGLYPERMKVLNIKPE